MRDSLIAISAMVFSRSAFSLPLLFLFILTNLMSTLVISQPALDVGEQEAVYRILESVNSDISWRSLFPDDLCFSAPHGVVCDFPSDDNSTSAAYITELSFGSVSDYSPNPPCSSSSTLDPSLFSSFTRLRKLFFYKCFTEANASFPDFSFLPSSIEELIFIENPSLFGSLGGNVSRLSGLRRLVVTGSNVSGRLPDGLGALPNLEQLTLSRNGFSGELSVNFDNMKRLKVLDLSQNGFEGKLPETLRGMENLLKLDLSFNRFSGNISESLKGLKELELLDLSYNRIANCGVPLFLAELSSLREVYLSGNILGGTIPDIWENLGGVQAIGLSSTGLVGKIPVSMGTKLRKLSYLSLDNNKLEGTVPEEFGALEFVNELYLENNKLSGKVPFSASFVSKIGSKLRLEGNPELCLDEGLRSAKVSGSLGQLRLCDKPENPKFSDLFGANSATIHVPHALLAFGLFALLAI